MYPVRSLVPPWRDPDLGGATSYGMYKKFIVLFAVVFMAGYFSIAYALTKPSPDADMDSLSYVFYLYYDNGQLFADRDFDIKFDVLNEKFTAAESLLNPYRAEIINNKGVTTKAFQFDPRQGNPTLTRGKVQIKGPYVSDAKQVTFYNNQGNPILNIFVNSASLCNDDGVCTSAEGENVKTCLNDCKQARNTPPPATVPVLDDGYDLNTILIYAVGGLGVLAGAWFGWKWWKKKRGENFLPPPPSAGESSATPFSPPPLS